MAAFAYEYRVKGLQKVSAQVAGEVCEELRKSEEGLTPSSLLDASRDENAPLHGEFEWNDGIAAENYRKNQAALLIRNIRCVMVTEREEEKHIRAFVNVDRGTSQYMPIKVVLEDEDMRSRMLQKAKADCDNFIGKYRDMTEVAGIVNAMQAFLRAV